MHGVVELICVYMAMKGLEKLKLLVFLKEGRFDAHKAFEKYLL